MGNGYSYYISNLNELNPVVISLLEKSQNSLLINCTINQKCSIEDDNKKLINKNGYFTHGFILDDININNIDFIIKIKDNEIKISFDKNKIIKLPDGDNLGKLIVDNYLKSSKCKDSKLRINLSKEYNILTDETAFYAKIANEITLKEKMVKMTNEGKEASNNKNEEIQNVNIKENGDYIYNDGIFGYDNEEDHSDDNIIKKKNFDYKSKKRYEFDDDCCCRCCCCDRAPISLLRCCCCGSRGYAAPDSEDEIGDSDIFSGFSGGFYSKKNDENNEIKIKKEFKFDDFILSQDVIEGNWTKNTQSEILIEQEKDIYEKIKKYSEDKGINEENGIITLFVLYYIHSKKSDKVTELKFVINKAKNYVKKIYNLDYDNIIKEIETK